MNDDWKEALSELIDGESDRFVARRNVRELLETPARKKLWARYHLVSDVMGNRFTNPLGAELLDGVRNTIDAEPPRSRSRPLSARLVRPIAGATLAASVVAIAVLGARFFQPNAEVMRSRTMGPTTSEAIASNRWTATQPTIEARLNRYLVSYSEYAGYGVSGMMPYARIVGYDASE